MVLLAPLPLGAPKFSELWLCCGEPRVRPCVDSGVKNGKFDRHALCPLGNAEWNLNVSCMLIVLWVQNVKALLEYNTQPVCEWLDVYWGASNNKWFAHVKTHNMRETMAGTPQSSADCLY
eukprot:scaffold89950_cov24-Tisochrysis_lutea.AAC.2